MKILPIFILTLLPTSLLQAAEPTKVWIDPEKAAAESPDFLVQGEYYQENSPWAAQVVALGDQQFDLYLLKKGLPGLGWTPDLQRLKTTGKTENGKTTFPEINGLTATIANQMLEITSPSFEKPLSLPRVTRQSPTLGASPPDGATVLFNGTDTKQWKNAQMEDGFLLPTGATSIPTFHDYRLHLEFRTPFQPFDRGQKRGNSGIYHAGRWETQILDSFGLDPNMGHAGGIYSIAPPALNMCLPPLQWQTYDVTFTAARFDAEGKLAAHPRITVKLNGTLIHNDLELPKDFTPSAPLTTAITNSPGPVYLQNHQNPVRFRHIWVTSQK